MFKVIIAGGRDFNDYDLLNRRVSKILRRYSIWANPRKGPVEIVHGGARGADTLGKWWGEQYADSVKEFPADWKNLDVPNCLVRENSYGKYNALAGNNRNIEMAIYSDALISFWDGKSTGTKDMISLTSKHGLRVRVIRY